MGTLIKKLSVAHPKVVDPVDIAYLALGAHQAWAQANDAQRDSLDGGQTEFVEEVVQAAPTLAALWDAQDDDSLGSWYYEVSEPLGLAIGKAIIEGALYDVEELARPLIRDIMPRN